MRDVSVVIFPAFLIGVDILFAAYALLGPPRPLYENEDKLCADNAGMRVGETNGKDGYYILCMKADKSVFAVKRY